MTAENVSRDGLIRRKLMAPGLPSIVVERPRVDALFTGLLEEHDVVGVFAVTGSGKTVQAQLFARQLRRPLIWLTLNSRDRSASRMLSNLAASLEPAAPQALHILKEGFARRLPLEEIAALLAEGVTTDRALVVFDQCEVLAGSAASAALLASFLDYLPRGVHTLLLERTEVPGSRGRLFANHRMGCVSQEDIALTEDEAAALARAQGHGTVNAVERCRRANGWMAAVAFVESGRRSRAVGSRHFFAFLGAEILGVLTGPERRFLLDTAILERISPKTATELCGPDAGSVWQVIQRRHLPATTMADGTIVLHSCFRGFLFDRLADEPDRLADLQRRHADILLAVGEFEEATELLLSVGGTDVVMSAAEKALPAVLGRSDWNTVLRWLESLGPTLASASPVLLGAKIRSLRNTFRLEEARALVRELNRIDRLTEVFAVDSGAISYAAEAMLRSPKEGLTLLDRFDDGSCAPGVRFTLDVISGRRPVQPPNELVWVENDWLIGWALMLQGRLRDLVDMLPTGDEWPSRGSYKTPYSIFGLLWRGDLERVSDLFKEVTYDVQNPIHTELWLWFEAWLLMVKGDAKSALICAERAVMHSLRSGSSAYLPAYQDAQAQALLALGQVDRALEVLDEALTGSRHASLTAYEEWCLTSLGRAYLMKGHAEDAAKVLRQAVAEMSNAGRQLFLPVAAVYLSEAAWRTGDEDASEAAASLAYRVSERMGGFTGLRMALGHFPAVLYRQIDLGSARTENWRHLELPASRPPSAVVQGRTVTSAEIQSFGPDPDVIVDGRPMGVGRLKAMELACYVAMHRGGVRRDDVQMHVFPDSDRRRGSNYFRQVAHQLRKATGLTFQRLPNSSIDWSPRFAVDTYDARFERMVAEAGAVGGQERLERLHKALDLVSGPYLPASELDWVADRSFQLDVLKEESELEIANLALSLGDFSTAVSFAERILAKNQSNAAAYRTLLDVELSSGTKVGALAVYRRAQAALHGTGLSLDPKVTARLNRHFVWPSTGDRNTS